LVNGSFSVFKTIIPALANVANWADVVDSVLSTSKLPGIPGVSLHWKAESSIIAVYCSCVNERNVGLPTQYIILSPA